MGITMNNINDFIKKYDMYLLNDKIDVDLRYATNNNFLHKKVYNNTTCLLRREVALKLLEANEYLKNNYNLKLCILDAYRPIEIQKEMYILIPNTNYVADPNSENCNHTKGNAVDVCLLDMNNKPLPMPSEFDHFGIESSRTYYRNNKINQNIKNNVTLLEKVMNKFGFIGLESEWWHFDYYKGFPIINEKSMN